MYECYILSGWSKLLNVWNYFGRLNRVHQVSLTPCIYQSNWPCGPYYIWGTIKQFYNYIDEHHPTWLSKWQLKARLTVLLLVSIGNTITLNITLSFIFHQIHTFVICVLLKLLESIFRNQTFVVSNKSALHLINSVIKTGHTEVIKII